MTWLVAILLIIAFGAAVVLYLRSQKANELPPMRDTDPPLPPYKKRLLDRLKGRKDRVL